MTKNRRSSPRTSSSCRRSLVKTPSEGWMPTWQAWSAPMPVREISNQRLDPLAIAVGGQMRPAGDRREHHGLGEDVLLAAELFTPIPRRVLPGAVEPVPFERRAMHQGLGGMYARPLAHPFHQVLVDPVGQDVLQALDLGGLFVGDGGHVVAVLEDRPCPVGQAVDL